MLGLIVATALAAEPAVTELDGGRRLLDGELPNGLRVTVLEDPQLPVVATQHWVHVGSAQEGPNERGFAHLFEHLMFGGTENVDAEAYARLHTAHGGYENAWTSFDETVYVSIVPPEVHAEVLAMEADRFQHLAVTAENLANEQRIVTEELRLRTQNDPFGRLAVRALEVALAGHPYGHAVTGTPEDVAGADLDLCRRFYETWYRPDHVHLVVAGPRAAEDVLADVERLYGAMTPSGTLPAQTPPVGTLPARLDLREDLPPVRVTGLAWRLPPTGAPDDATLELLFEALHGGEVDRPAERHVAETRRALHADTVHARLRAGGVFGIYSVSFFAPAKVAFRRLRRTVDEIGRLEWLTDDVLEAARRRLLLRRAQESWYADAVATAIGQAAWHHGDLGAWVDAEARLRAVTREDVVRAWRTWVGEAEAHEVLIRRGRPR